LESCSAIVNSKATATRRTVKENVGRPNLFLRRWRLHAWVNSLFHRGTILIRTDGSNPILNIKTLFFKGLLSNRFAPFISRTILNVIQYNPR
jgi:hypothetical protein